MVVIAQHGTHYIKMICKYWKKCKLYDGTSNTCNVTEGMYYDNRPAGCYRDMKKLNKLDAQVH
jgi:hypothetical protein